MVSYSRPSVATPHRPREDGLTHHADPSSLLGGAQGKTWERRYVPTPVQEKYQRQQTKKAYEDEAMAWAKMKWKKDDLIDGLNTQLEVRHAPRASTCDIARHVNCQHHARLYL